MKVYEVRYSGGDYEEAFDYSLGIHDSLGTAIAIAKKRMTEIEEKADYWEDDIDEFCINEWELNNTEPTECDVRCWFRAKGGNAGKFVLAGEYIDDDKYEPYDKFEAREKRREKGE